MNISQYEDKINKKFLPLFKAKEEILVSIGGAASGKTISVFQKAILDAINIPEYRCLVVRKGNIGDSKVTTWPSLLMAAEILGVKDQFKIGKLSHILCKLEDDKNNFIRCEDFVDYRHLMLNWYDERKRTDVVVDVIVEDAQNLTESEFQCILLINGLRQITLVLNPVLNEDGESWIKDRLFNKKIYFPGTHNSSIFTLHSTYKDNEFLDENCKSSLDNMGSLNTGYESVYKFGDWAAIN